MEKAVRAEPVHYWKAIVLICFFDEFTSNEL